ncbi:STAS domain-containing protein [Streptomyces sp. NPDC049813]|uniref:STAS domain-containing protein n=1 Tax=Streptomyces sp. NPDC049813 TaxID=3365597 RepID=UPI0037875338
MNITRELHGSTATLTPHGDIDYDHLGELRACLDRLPRTVTRVVWDLRDTPFVDVAGLHLFDTAPASVREVVVTHLRSQPHRLIETARALFPYLEWDRYRTGPDAQAA